MTGNVANSTVLRSDVRDLAYRNLVCGSDYSELSDLTSVIRYLILMRSETEAVVDEIKQSLALLRRHL
jgi:hypothetical protein